MPDFPRITQATLCIVCASVVLWFSWPHFKDVFAQAQRKNTAPHVTDISLSIPMNQSVEIVFAGVDRDNDPLRYDITRVPEKGSLGNIQDDRVIYTPDTGASGIEYIEYLAYDGYTHSEPATITLTIMSPYESFLNQVSQDLLSFEQSFPKKLALRAPHSYSIPEDDPASFLNNRIWAYDLSVSIIAAVNLSLRAHEQGNMHEAKSWQQRAERWGEILVGFGKRDFFNTPRNERLFQIPFFGSAKTGRADHYMFYTGSQFWNAWSLLWYAKHFPKTKQSTSFKRASEELIESLITIYYVDASKTQSQGGHYGDHQLHSFTGGMTGNFIGDHMKEWSSTEHNTNAGFVLLLAGEILKQKKYTDMAHDVIQALETHFWSEYLHRFYQGISPIGYDSEQALDTTSWSSLLMEMTGRTQIAETALQNSQDYKLVDPNTGIQGYRPYLYPDLVGVWPEGWSGVILAYRRIGERSPSYFEQAIQDSDELLRLREMSQGPMHYYTVDNPHRELRNWSSLISAAWSIIAMEPRGFMGVDLPLLSAEIPSR